MIAFGYWFPIYSKIYIWRPPLGLSKSGLLRPFWTVLKVVFFRGSLGVLNGGKIIQTNKILSRRVVLIFGGLNSSFLL